MQSGIVVVPAKDKSTPRPVGHNNNKMTEGYEEVDCDKPCVLDPNSTDGFVSPTTVSSSIKINPTSDTTNSTTNDTEPDPSSSGTVAGRSANRRGRAGPTDAIRRVTRVSRHAALTTKQAVWDSNELSIEAALSAVDQWEAAYNGLRSLLVHSVTSARGLYGAAKEGVGKLEHGLLIPVRDWILLPAFTGAERAVYETVTFLQSETARQLAGSTLHLAQQVPVIGDNVLAPAMCLSVAAVQRTWDVLQYPIPSRHQVRVTVDWTLTATKWVLSAAAREICLYAKRADANITRTLSHTQWKVLGSGPYATLDASNKSFVIDHLCERYFAVPTDVGRYELAAHVKRHNPALYSDLVLTGLLRERGGDITENDEWLCPSPIYRIELQGEEPFLIPRNSKDKFDREDSRSEAPSMFVAPLWFRLPQVNGKPPAKDTPWVCMRMSEQRALELKYTNVVHERNVCSGFQTKHNQISSDDSNLGNKGDTASTEKPATNEPHDNTRTDRVPKHTPKRTNSRCSNSEVSIAQWYNYNDATDVMVDQQRHAVSFYVVCAKCRQQFAQGYNGPYRPMQFGDICPKCESSISTMSSDQKLEDVVSVALPPVAMVMRPTFWRFYGTGDEVRRATWFLDTARNGLQPFDYEAQAVLEDAYLFLKWIIRRKNIYPGKVKSADGVADDDLDESLLTVEVLGPDGTDRLVQFSSLTQATAIQKGLGAAIAIFKRRVYRGAWLERLDQYSNREGMSEMSENVRSRTESYVSDVSLRTLLDPSSPLRARPSDRQIIRDVDEKDDWSLAVPSERLRSGYMAKQLQDEKEGKIDHLCLIVHGIGEMLRSVDLFGVTLPNLTSVCGSMRSNHAEVQDEYSPRIDATDPTSPFIVPGRVEYLPVEWHEAFSILTQRRPSPSVTTTTDARNVMIEDVSLPTIPNMRDFANDTLMDVLFFMSPEHHQIILDVVTHEMNLVVKKFQETTGFNGRISVIGHSLGSIICWDILNQQQVSMTNVSPSLPLRNVHSMDSIETEFDGSTSHSVGTGTPESSQASLGERASAPQLGFPVDNFFLLGSPVPVFLMIRNQRMPLSEGFYLRGCRRVFNIFHPYDPVAYRLEGCIDPRNSAFEPALIRHWNGGLRVQYRTRRLWRKLIETTCKTQRTVVEAFEQSMAGAFGIGRDYDDSASETSEDRRNSSVNTGRLNEGRRIDYMLQEKEIENANEYVAALAAHSSYWMEKDLSLFIDRQIYLSAIESSVALAEAAELAAWETITPDNFNVNNSSR